MKLMGKQSTQKIVFLVIIVMIDLLMLAVDRTRLIALKGILGIIVSRTLWAVFRKIWPDSLDYVGN